MIQDTLTQD